MKKMVIAVADTNDADYAIEITDGRYLTEERIERLKKIIETIKVSGKDMKWGRGEMLKSTGSYINDPHVLYKGLLTDEDIEFFEGFLPYGEFGIHAIEGVKLFTIQDEEVLI